MNFQPSGLVARFVALIIDVCFIALYALCLLGVSLFIYQEMLGGLPDVSTADIAAMQLLGFTTLTLPAGLYFFLTESGSRHATFGKRIAKIKVAAANGSVVSRRQAALRVLIKLLPWEFAHTLVYQVVHYAATGHTPVWVMVGLYLANLIPILYLLCVVIRKDHRGPHDLAAGTMVVRR